MQLTNKITKLFLKGTINKQPGFSRPGIFLPQNVDMSTISTSEKLRVEKSAGTEIINSVKIFFGIKIRTTYNKSRILRRPTKSYEEFIFKGYDRQNKDLSRSAVYKKIKLIGKN